MRWATAEATICSLIVMSTDKKQVDTQWYLISVIGISSLTASKVILFYAGISALEKEVRFIFELRPPT
jgi:bacteriorhodopsin